MAAIAVAAGTLAVTALNEHAPYDIQAGLVARVVAGLVPPIAAAMAGAAVLRPRMGFLVILLLTPVVNVAQVYRMIGPVSVIVATIQIQVIAQTILIAALAVGLVVGDREPSVPASAPLSPPAKPSGTVRPRAGIRSRISLPVVAAAAMLSMLTLATLSTANSPDVDASATVLLHGILEPAAMAFILIALRPTRRYLVLLFIAAVISVGLGGLLNMVQTVPAMGTLAAFQTNRLYFSRLTYFNVGLFGEMLAMTMPLLLALLFAHRRRYLRLPSAVLALLIATLSIDAVSLVLTFSKSAYLATVTGCLILLLMAVHTWRQRVPILVTATFISAVLIPWPALFLQAVPPLEKAYRDAIVSLMGESRYDSWDPSTLSGRGSLVERWYATQAAVQMAIDHPLLGIGLDQFKGQYVSHYRPPDAKLSVDWAHSMLPEVAAELGIPALLLDLLIYAAAALALWRVYRAPPDPLTRLFACALLASLVSWLVVGLAFAGDMYRPWRTMASDYVLMMILLAAGLELYWRTRVRPAAD